MTTVLRLLVVSFLLLSSAVSFALETKKDQVAAFGAVLSELKVHYGMIKFKEATFGITYDELEAKYLRLIDKALLPEEALGLVPAQKRPLLSPEEFRQLMIAFAAEFKDGHTNILRQTRDMWTLGIRAAAIKGRLYVVGFNDKIYNPNSTYPQLEVGDEVIAVDGKPVAEIAKINSLYMSLATENSRNMRALEMTINVPHRWLMAKKTGGPVSVTFKRGSKTFEGSFHWTNVKDYVDLASLSAWVNPEKSPEQKKREALEERPYTYGEGSTTKTYFSEGLAKLELPLGAVTDIGKLLNMQISDEKKKKEAKLKFNEELADIDPVTRLAAYTVLHEGKTLGVIRMPNYSPDDGFEAAVNELVWLARVVGIFENTTDAVIIDQLSNGGGYVYQFAQFVRLFANKGEMKTAKMDVKLSDTFIRSHDDIIDPKEDPEQPVEGEERRFSRLMLERQAFEEIKKKFEAGEKWSGWVSFFGGSSELIPNEAGKVVALPEKVYTKPVLLLNDGRSASGGDFMPAAMQASGRAVVMGETSMGLGGPVYRGQDSMPGSEVFMRCTMGFCLRDDGLPIENMGVVPQVRREIDVLDVKDGFEEYASDVLDVAAALAEGVPAKKLNEITAKVMADRFAAAADAVPTDAFKQVKKLVIQLNKSFGKDAKIGKEKGLTAKQIAKKYDAFFKKLGDIELSQIRSDEWESLKFKLPAILTAQDILLASQGDRDSVLNRLQEMTKVPAYKNDAGTMTLIESLSNGLKQLGQSARFDVCQQLVSTPSQ